jgi:hypothetical protein
MSEELTTRIIGDLAMGTQSKKSITAVSITERQMAKTAWPDPQMIPTPRDQNKNIRSMGFLTAVRNRTIERAPTIPSEITMLDWIVKIMADVISAMPAKEMLKLRE